MSRDQVDIRLRHDALPVQIRELTGFDEQYVRDVSTATAIGLLDRLVEHRPERLWRVAELTASERDRLLAALYQNTYGDRIRTTSACTECERPIDVAFSLHELIGAVERGATPQVAERLTDGSFCTAAGVRFRVPTGEDEMAIAALPPEEAEPALFARCLLDAPRGVDARAVVEDVIEEVAPVLDLVVYGDCPDCGIRNTVRFDVQFYLLRALEQERAQRGHEMHRIATAYGWSVTEILSLRRGDRRQFVELIESERLGRKRFQ